MKKSARDIHDSTRSIHRRALMLGAIQGAVVATLGWRLKTMQLDRADEFRLLSDGNSIKMRLLPPVRGLIHDRNGLVIAGNEANYRATITREEAGDPSLVIARLRHLIPMTDTAVAALLGRWFWWPQLVRSPASQRRLDRLHPVAMRLERLSVSASAR